MPSIIRATITPARGQRNRWRVSCGRCGAHLGTLTAPRTRPTLWAAARGVRDDRTRQRPYPPFQVECPACRAHCRVTDPPEDGPDAGEAFEGGDWPRAGARR